MALQSLDVSVVGPYIAGAWRKHLNTGKDPANGKWYTNGANGDGTGLYGGLADTVPSGLSFDQASLQYLPKQIVAASSIVDNSKGLTPESTLHLSYTHSDSSTITHTTTHSIGASLGVDVKGGVDFIVDGEVTVKFNVSYDFSYSSSTSTTTGEEQTFSQDLPITVPSGKIYKGVLLATVQAIQVPFRADIIVTGTSETWFEDRVNGHYNWMSDAGTLFGWINQFGCAGADSALYRNLGGGRGAVTVSGVLHAQQVADFQAQVFDITGAAPNPMPAAVTAGQSPMPGCKLVRTVNF